MQPAAIRLKDSIATKLLKVVFSFYFIVAVLVTLGHMVVEYYRTKDAIVDDLRQTQEMFGAGLSRAMWEFNMEQLQLTLEGMISLSNIVGASIEDSEQSTVAQVGKVAAASDTSLFGHSFPLVYTNEAGEASVQGKVTVYSSTDVVLNRVQWGFVLLLINAVVKTLALWGIFLWFGNRLLGRPLSLLAEATESVDVHNPTPLEIDVHTDPNNELKILEEGFNRMSHRLWSAHREIQAHMEYLDQTNKRQQILLDGTRAVTSSLNKLKVMIGAVRSLLKGVPLDRSVQVILSFRDTPHQAPDRPTTRYCYNHYQIRIEISATGTPALRQSHLDDAVHAYTDSPRYSDQLALGATRVTGCVLIQDTLVVPIWYNNELLGNIDLQGIQLNHFQSDDKDFVDTLSQSIGLSLKEAEITEALRHANEALEELNANLEQKVIQRTTELQAANTQLTASYETIKTQQDLLNDELAQARETQATLLPERLPKIPGAHVACKYSSMEQIGGDFYNVFAIDEHRYGLVVTDITGHGVVAALLSFMVSSVFWESQKQSVSPQLVLTYANNVLEEKLPNEKFASMVYAVYDSQTRKLTYCSGGHPEALIYRPSTQEIIRLSQTGMLVGLFSAPISEYTEIEVDLLPGDKLLLYTDAIIEAIDENGYTLGVPRLAQFLKNHGHLPIQDLLDQVYRYGLSYANQPAYNDDCTLVGLELELQLDLEG